MCVLQVMIPHDTAQAIFTFMSKIMMTVKIMKKVINSSSLTIGSSVMQGEAEFKNAVEREKPVDLQALITGLYELELKNQVVKVSCCYKALFNPDPNPNPVHNPSLTLTSP